MLKFRDFLATERPSFEYYNHLRLFSEAFGKVEVLTYEDLAASGLIDSFFAHLGIDVADIPGRPSANPSLPIDLVEFKRILNTTPLKPERLKEIGTLLLDKADKATKIERGKVDWLSVEEMADFYNSFAEENQKLRAEYLPGRSSPLFPPFVMPTGTDVPEVYGGMSANRLAHLVAELLL